MPKHSHDPDPLDELLRPPQGETEEDRVIRLAQEAEARRRSQAIDESIKAERIEQKKKSVVRLLLLGQSESGKSTTLRHFQRLYIPSAFRAERILWRSVIQLNVVRSVRTILDAVSTVRPPPTPPSNDIQSPAEDSDDDTIYVPHDIEVLKMRLSPLHHVEAVLIAKLIPPSQDDSWAPMTASSAGDQRWHHSQEIFVRPGATSWKGVLAKSFPCPTSVRPNSIDDASSTGVTRDEAQQVLHACCGDIISLWNNRFVRQLLTKRKIRLEEAPGFFLNDLQRVTALNYIPSDDDVLRARLKTVGVSEYRCQMEAAAGREQGTEWRIVDVGGSRSQRATWVPFFDDVDAIIFLAPISAFDQVLTEDRTVNRLEDSVLLWKAICSNKLLANVDLVLFLNKCDILEAKLKSGIRLAKYVRSYGDRGNDVETACKYFRTKFSAIHREYSPLPRKFYGFCTSVTDTTTTAGILASVRDMVVRRHLKQSRLL
ncbi:G-alpha-domain-containing protein [Pisolithus orientalis]|uniref:G-alpha-domain-containing protein n=1 Tax=Pisolithus orientalis TaxID=936130 RepID=UPI002224346C|nr:G-alpha-domain-containing protein [Pisolithus orientalis]KAI6001591.1 G-alpha-domain-containing protein [Pisolithus orientalis]